MEESFMIPILTKMIYNGEIDKIRDIEYLENMRQSCIDSAMIQYLNGSRLIFDEFPDNVSLKFFPVLVKGQFFRKFSSNINLTPSFVNSKDGIWDFFSFPPREDLILAFHEESLDWHSLSSKMKPEFILAHPEYEWSKMEVFENIHIKTENELIDFFPSANEGYFKYNPNWIPDNSCHSSFYNVISKKTFHADKLAEIVDEMKDFNWNIFSYNTKISSFWEKYKNKPWNFEVLSDHLDIDLIVSNPNYPWRWDRIEKRIKLRDIEQRPDFGWPRLELNFLRTRELFEFPRLRKMIYTTDFFK